MTIDLKNKYQKLFAKKDRMTLAAYLELAKADPSVYLSPHERLLKAIGEPTMIDTSKDPRLGRLHSNATIPIYDKFSDFYGIEDTIHSIIGFIKHAAQGLEESRQILYLLGPVGSSKSSLANRLVELMEVEPFYAIEGSPVYESPLGLFSRADADELNIPERYFITKPSPWLIKRLQETEGDLTKLNVVKLYPSRSLQVASSRTEPADESSQDVSSLVGKVNISKLHLFSQDDPDAYSYSGALCLGNRGILEFVEMFKAPIKTLNPLLASVQEHSYNGTEVIGALPSDTLVLSHSNASEWDKFRSNKINEAFLDRISLIKVPYNLRTTEEQQIYKKLLDNSTLKHAPTAPKTLEILSKFSVLSRLKVEGTTSSEGLQTKMKAYDGENVKETSLAGKPYAEYKKLAGINEGMDGLSTRWAFKILSKVFNTDSEETSADPVLLLNILSEQVLKEGYGAEEEATMLSTLHSLEKDYRRFLDEQIKQAYVTSFADYGQSMFERYISFVAAIHNDSNFRDPDTGAILDKEYIEKFLIDIEDSIGVSNRKDFRGETYVHSLQYQAEHKGKLPPWTADKKIHRALQQKIFSSLENISPVISFDGVKRDKKEEAKHNDFVDNMVKLGYSRRQVRRLVSWNLRTKI